jgi:hypothetical protein
MIHKLFVHLTRTVVNFKKKNLWKILYRFKVQILYLLWELIDESMVLQ